MISHQFNHLHISSIRNLSPAELSGPFAEATKPIRTSCPRTCKQRAVGGIDTGFAQKKMPKWCTLCWLLQQVRILQNAWIQVQIACPAADFFCSKKKAPVKYAIRHGTHSICAPKPNKLGTLLMYLKPQLVHLHSPSSASVERGATKFSKSFRHAQALHLLHGVLNKVYPHQVSR